MTIRPILTGGAPILHQVAAPVQQFDDDLHALVGDLFDTMYHATGRGLAAPQIGVPLRVFVMDATWKGGDKAPLAVINPVIRTSEWPMLEGEEACLSIPGRTFRVARPMVIDLAWISPEGVEMEQRLRGSEARIACHEVDHLDGILVTRKGVEI